MSQCAGVDQHHDSVAATLAQLIARCSQANKQDNTKQTTCVWRSRHNAWAIMLLGRNGSNRVDGVIQHALK
jgi:uncharacterized membrane protein